MKQISSKLRATILIFNIFLSTLMLFGQEQVGLRTQANQLFYQDEYFAASKIYLKLVDTKKPKQVDLERLAESYYQINEYDLAQNWYARVIQSGKFLDKSQLHYADVLRKVGDYAAAKQQLESLRGRVSYSDELDLALKGADSAVVWMANPTKHQLINQTNINTRFSQFGGFPLSNAILFSGEPDGWSQDLSGRTGRPFLRSYTASLEEDGITLQYPNVMPEFFNNVPYHIGAVIADRDQKTLYVTRTYIGDELQKKRVGQYKFGSRNLEILIYHKDGNDWVESAFPYNNSKAYSVGHAALSNDEQTLYFASNMPGSLGGTDIWFCELQSDGSWGKPKNAGPVVNSAGNELFPYVFGEKLYYSSDGFVGMGGLDIYEVTGERNQFTNHTNLLFPINSAFDDFAFIPVGESHKKQYGYVSSDRKGGMGLDDIYAFIMNKPVGKILIEARTLNAKDGSKLPNAQLQLTDNRGQILVSKASDEEGAFSFYVEDDELYRLSASMNGFHRDSITIKTQFSPHDTTMFVSLNLQPVMKKGNVFILQDIYYDLDKYAIREDAKIVLNQLVKTLRDNPSLIIELSSHTDSRATKKYNMRLSQQRAQSAVNYLVDQGIARERLKAKGYGESKLLNHCKDGVNCSETEHQMNRRTEIKVLEY